jgi:hypothetical protein
VQDAAEPPKIGTAAWSAPWRRFHGRHYVGIVYENSSSHARLNVPALVQVAAFAIILIRGLDLLMILNLLGVQG